jgi:hypothetical protein
VVTKRVDKATAAYWTALERLRRGKPAIALARKNPGIEEIRRFYIAPPQCPTFESDSALAVSIEPEQGQSVFLLHNSLNDLHPKVKKACPGREPNG